MSTSVFLALPLHPRLLTRYQQSSKPFKIKAQATPGYIYLYSEDGTVAVPQRLRHGPVAS
jgi:hypothetical protein